MWVLGLLLVAYEFQNALSWWRGRTIRPGDRRSSDFTIVVPLFGPPAVLRRAVGALALPAKRARRARGRLLAHGYVRDRTGTGRVARRTTARCEPESGIAPEGCAPGRQHHLRLAAGCGHLSW